MQTILPLSQYRKYPLEEVQRRRIVRHFSDRPVPRDPIEICLRE
ncbi:MAG: hypothetical protein U0401_13420 [Anaerolineae bacterium]